MLKQQEYRSSFNVEVKKNTYEMLYEENSQNLEDNTS